MGKVLGLQDLFPRLQLLADEWDAEAQAGESENLHTEGTVLSRCADRLRATVAGTYVPDPSQYEEEDDEDWDEDGREWDGWEDEDDEECPEDENGDEDE